MLCRYYTTVICDTIGNGDCYNFNPKLFHALILHCTQIFMTTFCAGPITIDLLSRSFWESKNKVITRIFLKIKTVGKISLV